MAVALGAAEAIGAALRTRTSPEAQHGDRSLMILASAAGLAPALQTLLLSAACVSVYLAVFLCVARGVPVLLEARRLL